MSRITEASDRSQGTAVARREQGQQTGQTVAQMVHNMGPELQRALPKHLNGDRLARIALTLIRVTPKLGLCTPESFAGSLFTSAALGLEPGINGESYLIPYEDRRSQTVDCQLQVGYQGMQKLAWQSPIMRNLGSGFVFPEDDFDYEDGMDAHLRHKPAKGVQRDADAWPILFYAWAELKTGGRHLVVLDRAEVKALRQGKEGPDPRFKGGDPQHWMSRKTCVRQLLKPLPKSVEAYWATQVDEQSGGTLYAQQVPQQIAEQVEAQPDRPALESPEAPGEHYATPEESALKPDPWAEQ